MPLRFRMIHGFSANTTGIAVVNGRLQITLEDANKVRKYSHIGFEIGLILKGLDGLLEITGGFLLLYVSPERLNRFVRFLTQHELTEDPRDILANLLLTFSRHFSLSFQSFGIFYLLSHGLSKLIIIFLLRLGKLWAYPLSIAFLLFFVFYQIYRYTYSRSVFLLLLTALDMLMISLTVAEYGRIRAHKDR